MRICNKTSDLETCHTDVDPRRRHQIHTQPVFARMLTTRMVRSTGELFAIKKMAAQRMSIKKIAETFGVSLRTTKWWLQRLRSEGEMVPHDVRRPRGAKPDFCNSLSSILCPSLDI